MTNALDSLKDTLQSDQFKKILPYLLLGGAGAAGGAYMTGARRRNRRNPESRLGYLGRVLKNSLIAGGLTAGVAGLARYGMDKLDKQTTSDGKQLAGMDNPTDQALRSALFSPVTALGAGTAGLLATHKIPAIGANTAARDKMRESFAKVLEYGSKGKDGRVDPNVTALLKASPVELSQKLQQLGITKVDGLDIETARRVAGLTLGASFNKAPLTDLRLGSTLKRMISSPSSAGSEINNLKGRFRQSPVGNAIEESAKAIREGFQKVEQPNGQMTRDFGAIKQIPGAIMNELQLLKNTDGAKYKGEQARQFLSRFSRRGLATLGQSGGRRTFRTGLGLTAATIPALVGAFATDEKAN
jgi:hypothetical protein